MATVSAPHLIPSRLITPWGVLVFQDRKLQGVVPLGQAPLRVGRGMDCEIVIDEPSVSRIHCSLLRVDGCVVATDLESTNGTWRFGERIRRSALKNGDELSVGKALIKLVELGSGGWSPHEDLYSELYLDGVTGLHNRRGLRVSLDGCLGVLPAGTDLGLILASIDGIHDLGHRHGTAAQQRAVQHVAQQLVQGLPRGAIAARIGVGEFALVYPGLAQARLALLAESLRVAVKEAKLSLASKEHELTMSVGVASQSLPVSSLSALFCAAEDALFRACSRR